MPTIADVILNVENLRAERLEAYHRLVEILADDQMDVDAADVDTVITAAGKSMRALALDVDRIKARKQAAATLATIDTARAARDAAEVRLSEVTHLADAEVKAVRDRHRAELAAATAARDAKVAEAAAVLDQAAGQVGDCEASWHHLRDTAAPHLVDRVAQLRQDRDRVVARIEELRARITESERIMRVNPLVPDRDESVRPFGGSRHEEADRRATEQKARQSAAVIHERETRHIESCRSQIAEAEGQLQNFEVCIAEAEAALLVP